MKRAFKQLHWRLLMHTVSALALVYHGPPRGVVFALRRSNLRPQLGQSTVPSVSGDLDGTGLVYVLGLGA